MKLEGKLAVVIGGGSGIGQAVSSAFLKKGAKVSICSLYSYICNTEEFKEFDHEKAISQP